MQETLFTLLKIITTTEFQRPDGVYNIFPKHIPDGAIDNNYSQALIYNFLQSRIVYTAVLHTIQLTVFHLDYSECRRLSLLIIDAINNKNYTADNNNLLSSLVTDTIELEYDKDTGYYGIAINTLFKTNKNI